MSAQAAGAVVAFIVAGGPGEEGLGGAVAFTTLEDVFAEVTSC